MPSVTYQIKYRKNTDEMISPEELLSLYFYGIDIKSQDGTSLSSASIRMYIKAAQREIERFLDIRFKRKLLTETVDYYKDDYWYGYPKLKVSLPVEEPFSMIGMINTVEQIIYPKNWLNSKRSSEGLYYKDINIVPVGSTGAVGTSEQLLLTGLTRQIGITSYKQVPNYFNVQYTTGFKEIPFDLLNVVGKLASIGVLNIAGDLILGAGIASMSLGVDGLSQSIASTSSATSSGYGARIIQYSKEINDTLKRLKLAYKSLNLIVL